MWELLIENYCRQNRVKAALQVFDDWKAASDSWTASQQYNQPQPDDPAHGAAATAALSIGGADADSSATAAEAAAASAAAASARYPKLSYVSLAFLEACCRGKPDYEWRVFDVCAVMRQQKELKRQAGLARPQKLSHHFAPA
jgi:pentatricopeptide repeat protein